MSIGSHALPAGSSGPFASLRPSSVVLSTDGCATRKRPSAWSGDPKYFQEACRVPLSSICMRVHGSAAKTIRSEEHTSELQSLMRNSYAVFCLKKKKTLANLSHDQHRSTNHKYIIITP